ncbi:type II toxin-antitoxin system HipA family toxin [Cellulomonas biazotea]|uniref:type II toxin-antitoxin system HipA family toxin n=1 Tax=Cellulomonas biazotea TaxID=1709 RepID=UPI0035E9A463
MSVRELAFALYGVRAGVIVRDRGRTTLTYDDAYLARPESTPLSLSMPLSDTPYPTRFVEAYLKGLLPDHGDVRERWASRFRVAPGDTLGLVAAIGADTAGGAVFAPVATLDDVLARGGAVEPLSTADVAARLRRLREDDAAWHEDDEHWSLAGGQGKFTLTRTGPDGWGLPSESTPSTHIVKPGIARIRAQALAEHVSMRALRTVGLSVAATSFDAFDDQWAIVVERFDRRRRADGSIDRIHQEDLVQTFALDPRRKYEADRGPGVARIVDRLRGAADEDSVDRFVDATIAGYLLGAPDGHAKNYSVLLAGRAVTLAPLYDVSTGLIPDASGRLRYRSAAMSIGGERRFGEVERAHWDRFATVVGRPASRVRDRVAELARAVPTAVADAIAEAPASADATYLRKVVQPAVEALGARTVAGLSSSRRIAGRVVQPFLETLERSTSPSGEVVDEPWDGAQDRG